MIISITKDLSRLGRDYLKTGELIEMVFPDYDVRYIAINDGVDTFKSENELMAFKNIFNDWYHSLSKTQNSKPYVITTLLLISLQRNGSRKSFCGCRFILYFTSCQRNFPLSVFPLTVPLEYQVYLCCGH